MKDLEDDIVDEEVEKALLVAEGENVVGREMDGECSPDGARRVLL